MGAKRMKQEVTLLFIFPFLQITFSCQAATITSTAAPSSSPLTNKEAVIEELVKAVGHPTVGAADYGDWMLSAVRFIMERMNWQSNVVSGGHDKKAPDVKFIEEATQKILTAVGWIVADPELNPYRSLKAGMPAFSKLFRYVRDLEKRKVFGGEQNTVYSCFKSFWTGCEARAPATLEVAMVYRFECGWELYEKCRIEKCSKDGKWHVPHLNRGHFV